MHKYIHKIKTCTYVYILSIYLLNRPVVLEVLKVKSSQSDRKMGITGRLRVRPGNRINEKTVEYSEIARLLVSFFWKERQRIDLFLSNKYHSHSMSLYSVSKENGLKCVLLYNSIYIYVNTKKLLPSSSIENLLLVKTLRNNIGYRKAFTLQSTYVPSSSSILLLLLSETSACRISLLYLQDYQPTFRTTKKKRKPFCKYPVPVVINIYVFELYTFPSPFLQQTFICFHIFAYGLFSWIFCLYSVQKIN